MKSAKLIITTLSAAALLGSSVGHATTSRSSSKLAVNTGRDDESGGREGGGREGSGREGSGREGGEGAKRTKRTAGGTTTTNGGTTSAIDCTPNANGGRPRGCPASP